MLRRHLPAAALIAALGLAGCGPADDPPADAERSEAPPAPDVEPPEASPTASAEAPSAAEADSAPPPAATPPPGTPELREARALARARLTSVIDCEAGDPANAWALAHGILARGPDFRATDGRLARYVLADDFLEAETVGGRKVPRFPRTRGEVRVEPHTDLVLKTLVEAGVPLGEPLSGRKGAPTLRQLLESSQLRFEPARAEGESLLREPNDAPWSVQAWCQAAERSGITSWTTAAAGEVELEEASAALLGTLERETWFIRQAMANGQRVEKRKQGIFAYTCGGAHLFQGVEACAAAGWPRTGNTKARIDTLVDLYLFRVPLETELVERSIRQYPALAPILYNQDVKFLGHLLESLGKAERDGLWSPTAAELDLLDQVEARLLFHVLQLEKLGVYEAEAMKGLAANEETVQFYLDLVGDACHAWSGLELQAALRAAPDPGQQPAPTE